MRCHPIMRLQHTPFTATFLLLSVLASLVSAAPMSQKEQRVVASYLLAFGRSPTAAESEKWSARDPLYVSLLVTELSQELHNNSALQKSVAEKAFVDTFGEAPTAEATPDTGTYTHLVEQNLNRLAHDSARYRKVIDRAYRKVVRRPLYDEEVGYWTEKGVLPFVLLVSCLDEWARRNQPGLMITTGPAAVSANCIYLDTVQLQPAIAEEARAAIGFSTASASDFAYSNNRTIIAPGGNKLVSNGRVQLVAAGAPDILN